MAYKLEERIDVLLNRAMEASDISNELAELQIPISACKEELLNHGSEVSQPGLGLMDEYAQLENRTRRLNPLLIYHNRSFVVTLLGFGSLIFGLFYLASTNFVPERFKPIYDNYFIYLVIILGIIAFINLARAVTNRWYEFKNLRVSLKTQEELIDAEILENGVKPFLRLYINDKKFTSLETTLSKKDAPGLWAIMDTAFEVPNETKVKVERMISSLSGGSIGIAGPRGVGKSTLLTAICHPDRKEFQGQPTLTILTTVPVKYDAKDFILHLYSQVCQKVIQLELANNPRIILSTRRLAEARVLSGIRDLIIGFRTVVFTLLIIGSCGIFSSVLWATDSYRDENSLLRILEISPGGIFKISTILLAIGVFFLLILFSGSNSRYRPQANKKRGEEDELTRLLIFEAERRLEEITYQMSFSEGWAGGMKLPESIQFIESNAEYSYIRTRNPSTLPEIISEYCIFRSCRTVNPVHAAQ